MAYSLQERTHLQMAHAWLPVTGLLLRTQWICLHQGVTITDRLYSGPYFWQSHLIFLRCIQCLRKYF